LFAAVELVADATAPERHADEASRAGHLQALARWNRFENLLHRHERRLRRLALAMLGDPHRVDDVMQDAFFNAYRRLPARFDTPEKEAAWIYRVVHRACLTELRTRRRRPQTVDLESHAAHLAAADLPKGAEEVLTTLAALPDDQRAVVLLVDMIGFDYETTAAILRVPRGTVASRLNVARRRLRDLLGGDADAR
jgi:RNA polymerase sigma-70 factor (ECF subfamily)